MLKVHKNKKAQAIMGEYLLIFFIVLGALTTMSVFFRRLMQAKARDARDYTIDIIRSRTQAEYNGLLYYEYEPYYGASNSIIESDIFEKKQLLPSPGFASGIFVREFNQVTDIQTESETAPPKLAD